MPNLAAPLYVSARRVGVSRWDRVPYRILLFAVVLVLACCLTARAAVVEAEGVEREVDTPAGAQSQTLDDAAPPPVTQVEAPVANGDATAPSPGATTPGQPFVPLEVVTATPEAPTGTESGGGGKVLGFVVIGVIVLLIGIFVFAARGRGRR